MDTVIQFSVFFLDGLLPENSQSTASELSAHWLAICHEILDRDGPVFTSSMGGSLSHFEIELAGTIGRLFAYGKHCFDFSVSTGIANEKNLSTVSHFEHLYRASLSEAGLALSEGVAMIIRNSLNAPSVLLFDRMVDEIPEDQKSALAQLGMHFGTALIQYIQKK